MERRTSNIEHRTSNAPRWALRLLFVLCLLPVAASAVQVFRFPKPAFDSGYEVPMMPLPAPRSDVREWTDVAVLAVALALSAAISLRWRSRRAMMVLMLACLAYFGFYRKGCVCPVGAVQNIAQALADPTYIVPGTVIAFFVLPLAFALFYGRAFCASVCPLGALQDIVAVKPVAIPGWLNRVLGLLRHLYLAMAVIYVVCGMGFIVCRYDPFVAFFRLGANPGMMLFGAVVLAAGVFIARPYCRFACPYGVLLGWAARLSRRHVTITPDDCIQCRLCEESCPFDAILPPTPPRAPESRRRGVRRVGLVLAALPLIVAASTGIGMHLNVALSRSHRTVALAERVQQEDAGRFKEYSLESDAFRRTGKTRAELFREALAVRGPLRVAGGWMGAYMGLVIGVTLVQLSVRRSRRDFVPDRSDCLSCARCFRICPREAVRRGTVAGGATHPPPTAAPPMTAAAPRGEGGATP